MTTSELFTDGLDSVKSSPEDSPAQISAVQAERLVLKGRPADYGENTLEWFAKFDRATSSWKTAQSCLLEGSTRYSETWPRSGMTRNGTAYQLPTLAPPLTARGGIDVGLWPTPTTGDAKGRGYHGSLRGNYWLALPGAISLAEGRGPQSPLTLKINPAFLEWLMGFPIGHTELPPSETRFARPWSKPSGEPSSLSGATNE